MISTVSYQPNQSIKNLFHDMSVQSKQCKKLLNQSPKCSFSLSTYQLFHFGQTPQILNTLLPSISFNNPIWINTLCTWQSKNDVFYATNFLWTDLPLCNKHFSKVLDLSGFQRCGHHSSCHGFRFIMTSSLSASLYPK